MSNELKDAVKSAIIEVLEPFQDLVMKRLDLIEQKQDLIEQKQDLIIDHVVRNSEDITVIKNEQQVIKETVIQIVQTQQNQHRIIELLAVRSIEQEAALKRVI